MKTGLWFLGLGASFLAASQASADGSNTNYLMVSLGDSLTAAAFADTSTQTSYPVSTLLAKVLDMKGDLQNGVLWTIVDNKTTFSWASGQNINSHYLRLQKYLQSQSSTPITLNVANLAISGDVSADLNTELDQLDQILDVPNPPIIPYLTLFMGANDACDGVSANAVYANVLAALKRISMIKQSEPIKVLIPEIPTIPELGQDAIKNYTTAGNYTCEFIRSDVMNFCNTLTHWNDQTGYQQNIAVIDETNAALVAAAQEASKEFPNLQIHTSSVIHDFNLYVQILGAECFHPNQIGQAQIAEDLWDDLPWFK